MGFQFTKSQPFLNELLLGVLNLNLLVLVCLDLVMIYLAEETFSPVCKYGCDVMMFNREIGTYIIEFGLVLERTSMRWSNTKSQLTIELKTRLPCQLW